MKRKFDLLDVVSFPAILILFGIFAGVIIILGGKAIPAFERFGFNLIFENIWHAAEEPSQEKYGLLAVLWGSVYTSLIAVVLSSFLAVGYAVFVVEFAPKRLKNFLVVVSDIMAGLPTIIYGIWGSFILVPFLKNYIMQPLYEHLSFIPIFDYPPITGYSYFSAGVLLAIMVTPFSTSIIREAYEMIPFTYKEAALSLGATKYEAIKLLLGYIKPAVYSGTMLAFGRAVGETVAVSLVIGNTFNLTYKIFAPGYTTSSLIANQFGNAFIYEYMQPVMFAAGLLLFVIGISVSFIESALLRRWRENVKI